MTPALPAAQASSGASFTPLPTQLRALVEPPLSRDLRTAHPPVPFKSHQNPGTGGSAWPSTEVFSASQLCPLAGRASHREAGVRQASCEGTDLTGVSEEGCSCYSEDCELSAQSWTDEGYSLLIEMSGYITRVYSWDS